MQTPSDKQVGLTAEDIADIRKNADDDAFFFAKVICGHRDLTVRTHAPLVYLAAGQVDKLISLLENPNLDDSFVLNDIRRELNRHSIDYLDPMGRERFIKLMRVLDIRVYRGSAKSSAITHGVRLWKMTRDPNITACIISNTDPKAVDFCKQIRATILSDIYKVVYPDRVPDDPKSMLIENRITLAGRTVPDKEPCLMAFGHKSSPVGYHFDELHFDDLVGRENKSPLELQLVHEFLANVAGLYNPGIRYPISRLHLGTRWDDEDDATKIRAYAHCFAVTVPVWTRDSIIDDITIKGKPTTDWTSLERIVALQEEILSNPEEGPISWRCNFELDPAIAGGRIFPAPLVDNADWSAFRDAVVTQGREWVARAAYNDKGERMTMKDGVTPKSLAFDKDTLYKVTCCDQSFSDDGDEWAVGTVGMDQYGHRFVLEMATGHGVEEMLDAILMQKATHKPVRIGMEKIAAQHVIEIVLKLDAKYRYIRPLVEPINHNNRAKEWRIRNYVAEIMKMRRLWLDPKDFDTKQEMKKYKPGKNAKDNRLDVLAMCEVLIQKSLLPQEDEQDYRKKFQQMNRANQQRRDRFTGIALW